MGRPGLVRSDDKKPIPRYDRPRVKEAFMRSTFALLALVAVFAFASNAWAERSTPAGVEAEETEGALGGGGCPYEERVEKPIS